MATKVITGKCRLSYEHVWQPRATVEGGEPKYSANILIPKTDITTVEAVKAAIKAECLTEWPDRQKRPQNWKNPLKDGDGSLDKNGAQRVETVGHYIINATSKQRPGIVNAKREDIINKEEVYSGCYCRFQIAFATYNLPTSKGVGCYLNNIQKVADGPSLSGREAAKDVFDRAYEHEGKAGRPVVDESPDDDDEIDDEDKKKHGEDNF